MTNTDCQLDQHEILQGDSEIPWLSRHRSEDSDTIIHNTVILIKGGKRGGLS